MSNSTSTPPAAEIAFWALAQRARALSRPGTRRILGIAGPPGAGKSSLAGHLLDTLGGNRARLVPMDGFHLAQRELRRLGRAGRKGAPDTFDATGFVALLRRLRVANERVVYAPEFRREIDEPVAGAIAVPQNVPLVITEGNYLLLDTAGFAPVRGLLDEVWFLAPDDEERVARLIVRHEAYGRSAAAAREWVLRSDEANARLVRPTAVLADLVLRKVTGVSLGPSQEVPAEPPPHEHHDNPGHPPGE